jgi:hypothetical protein
MLTDIIDIEDDTNGAVRGGVEIGGANHIVALAEDVADMGDLGVHTRHCNHEKECHHQGFNRNVLHNDLIFRDLKFKDLRFKI